MADPYTWIFRAGSKRLDVRVSGRLHFGNPYISLAAARAGFGIARVPDFVVENNLKNGELVRLLEKYEPAGASDDVYRLSTRTPLSIEGARVC